MFCVLFCGASPSLLHATPRPDDGTHVLYSLRPSGHAADQLTSLPFVACGPASRGLRYSTSATPRPIANVRRDDRLPWPVRPFPSRAALPACRIRHELSAPPVCLTFGTPVSDVRRPRHDSDIAGFAQNPANVSAPKWEICRSVRQGRYLPQIQHETPITGLVSARLWGRCRA